MEWDEIVSESCGDKNSGPDCGLCVSGCTEKDSDSLLTRGTTASTWDVEHIHTSVLPLPRDAAPLSALAASGGVRNVCEPALRGGSGSSSGSDGSAVSCSTSRVPQQQRRQQQQAEIASNILRGTATTTGPTPRSSSSGTLNKPPEPADGTSLKLPLWSSDSNKREDCKEESEEEDISKGGAVVIPPGSDDGSSRTERRLSERETNVPGRETPHGTDDSAVKSLTTQPQTAAAAVVEHGVERSTKTAGNTENKSTNRDSKKEKNGGEKEKSNKKVDSKDKFDEKDASSYIVSDNTGVSFVPSVVSLRHTQLPGLYNNHNYSDGQCRGGGQEGVLGPAPADRYSDLPTSSHSPATVPYSAAGTSSGSSYNNQQQQQPTANNMNSRKYKLKNNNGGSQPNSVFGGEGKVALDGGTFKSGSPAPGGVGIVGTAGSGLEDSGDSDREGGGTLGRGDDRSGSLTRRTMGKMTVKELQELKRSEDKRRSDKKKEEKRKKRRKKDDGSGDASDSRDNTLTRETIGKDNNGAELSDEEDEDNRVKEGNTVNSLSSANATPVSGVADDNVPSEGGDENGGESNKAFEEVTDNIKPETPPVVSAVEEQEPVVSVDNTEPSSREIIEQPPEQPTPPVTTVDNTNTTPTAASTPATDKHSTKAGEEEEEEEKANNADDDDDDDDDDAVFEDARDSGPVGNVLNVPPKEEKQRNSSVTFAPEPETLNPEDEKKKISVTFEDETKPEKKKEKRKSFLKRRESSKKEKEKEEKKKKEKEKKNSKKDKKKSSKKKKGDEILLDSETEKTEESELDTCKSNDDDDKEDLKDELALEKAKLIEKAQVAIETDEGEITGENEKTEGKKNKKEKKKERKSKKSKKKKKGKDSNEPAADQLIIVGLEDSCIIPRKERPEEKKVDIVQLREDEEKEDQKLFEKFKRREKSRKRNEKIKECCKKFAAFLFSHIGLCGLVVGYSIMGGFVFKALEAPFEYTTKLDIRNHRDDYVKELWTIAVRLSGNSGFEEISSKRDNFTTKVNDVLKRFQELLFDATKNKGWDGKDAVEGEEPELQWSYAGALLYAVTVITTIGKTYLTIITYITNLLLQLCMYHLS